jgi:exodeoxyribonuclease V gamma subunit
MNGLHLYTSNRLENLVAELAGVITTPLGSPFLKEIIMVQSLGMRRWLTLEIAERLGICMQCEFPFPLTFLTETLHSLIPEMAERPAPPNRDAMTWSIYRLLPVMLKRPEFAPVRGFLADEDDLKRYQLAAQIAGLFDQYLLFRPELLLDWEADEWREDDLFRRPKDAAWQCLLWREITRQKPAHFAAALDELRHLLPSSPSGGSERETEGQRVSIFGIASLAPAQLEILFHLAATRPVHLFLLSPSAEYHGDALTPKQWAKRTASGKAGELEKPDINQLLTSLGRLNAHFMEVILENDERAGSRIVAHHESYAQPREASLLHQLQHDILTAQTPTKVAEGESDRPVITAKDFSLQIHSCHAQTREVEVLYDQLLAMLDATGESSIPGLKPRDVLVMAPDIESYAPLIHAVFGYPEDPALRIPYSVADRHPRSESAVMDTFLRLLALPGSRASAPELLSLLQTEPIARKFSFSTEDLLQIGDWIEKSGIRWGMDDDHRQRLGITAFQENTWQHGIDRLLLGYAMRGGAGISFESIFPYDDMEGSSTELLGRFVSALLALHVTVKELEGSRPLLAWAAILEEIVNRFFADDDEPASVGELRQLFAPSGELASCVVGDDAGQAIPYEVLQVHLQKMLDTREQRGHFLTGGVTFCALKPMRSIPARVIWLLGMNEADFPRQPNPLQFDLMSKAWKLGDRSPRDDDRYIFLEALISARERLCISYVGRSQQSNEAMLPSIVVSELVDTVTETLRFAPGLSAKAHLFFEHRLQAFSRSYFGASAATSEAAGGSPRLFSYSRANAAASYRPAAPQLPDFTKQPLPEAAPEMRTVSVDQLADFLKNPAACFLKHRLGMHLSRDEAPLPESEPLEIHALDRYKIKDRLLRNKIADTAPFGQAHWVAESRLSPGEIGKQHLKNLEDSTQSLHARIILFTNGNEPDDPAQVALKLGQFNLTGRLESLYAGKLVLFRPANLKAKDYLSAWVQHLTWGSLAEISGNPVPVTTLIGEDETVQFKPSHTASEANCQKQLQDLLNIYWQGLHEPLPFFPESALIYGTQKKVEHRLNKAWDSWAGNSFKVGEKEDSAYRLCFPAETFPARDFASLAEAIVIPMLTAVSKASSPQ